MRVSPFFPLRRCLIGALVLSAAALTEAQTTPPEPQTPEAKESMRKLGEALKALINLPEADIKTLRGEDTFIFLQELRGQTSLQVAITAKKAETILYSEIKVKVFDDSGREIPARREMADVEAYSKSPIQRAYGMTRLEAHVREGEVSGLYLFTVREGHRAVSVELTRGGEKQRFAVRQVMEAIAGSAF